MWLTGQSVDDFTFNVKTSQVLLDWTSLNEWVVESNFIHHIDKDASLLSSLYSTLEKKIYLYDEFGLGIVGHGDVTC